MSDKIALWCSASIADHVKTSVSGTHLHVEGFTRKTNDLSSWFELRLTGPIKTQITLNQYKVVYRVDLGMVVVGSNGFALQSLLDVGLAALTNEIPVYRYGPSSDQENDESCIGVLVLTPGTVVPTIFDPSPQSPDMRQANLEAEYRMFVNTLKETENG